jgi:hypothetical protein
MSIRLYSINQLYLIKEKKYFEKIYLKKQNIKRPRITQPNKKKNKGCKKHIKKQ